MSQPQTMAQLQPIITAEQLRKHQAERQVIDNLAEIAAEQAREAASSAIIATMREHFARG